MKIEDLKLFTTVVELGSFTATANALDLPRSNVSRRINALEESLSVKLFFRTTRKVTLTHYGRAYFDEVIKALAALERANQVMVNIAEAPKGRIKIGLLPETSEALSPVLFSFQDQYPGVELDIHSIRNGLIDIFQQGLDIAIHAGHLPDSNLVAKKVIDLQRILVASPDYLNHFGSPQSLQALTAHNCLCFRWPNGQLDNNWELGGETLSVNSTIFSNSIGILVQGAIQGRGVGFLPQLIVNQEITSGRLIRILPELKSKQEEGWLLYPQSSGITKVTRLLVDYLADQLPKLS